MISSTSISGLGHWNVGRRRIRQPINPFWRLFVTLKFAPPAPRVKRLDLARFDPLDEALESMHFGQKGMTRVADDHLAQHGLSRAHRRILFIIARRDGISVGEARSHLGITAQALHGPLKRLLDNGFVAVSRDPTRHRYKALHLTELGRDVEYDASEQERSVMRAAFGEAGDDAATSWMKVMASIAKNA